MFVSFLGQAFTSTPMSCNHVSDMKMSTMTHHDMLDTTSLVTTMLGSNENSQQANLMACCQEQCECPMSGCVSLSVLLNTRFNVAVFAEQKIPQVPFVHKSEINPSLFRPPIS